jgi:hypothetical protein
LKWRLQLSSLPSAGGLAGAGDGKIGSPQSHKAHKVLIEFHGVNLEACRPGRTFALFHMAQGDRTGTQDPAVTAQTEIQTKI